VIVQVNGRLRAKLMVEDGLPEADLVARAKADEKVSKEISGKQIVKTIVVPNKLVNIVVK
jgi:leucyl-tRNA synthetase